MDTAGQLVGFRDQGQDIPEQSHGNPKLEIALTILPAIILAGIAVPSWADEEKSFDELLGVLDAPERTALTFSALTISKLMADSPPDTPAKNDDNTSTR